MREKTTLVADLISVEFKYHDKCRKELIRDDRDTSVVGQSVDGFKKVTDYVDNYVLKMNQVVSMNIVYSICYGVVSSELRQDTIAKRKQRLKNMIHDYYGEIVIIIGTRSNHSEVLINSKNLDSEVTLNLRIDHKECCQMLSHALML